jgi:hypothetical protein
MLKIFKNIDIDAIALFRSNVIDIFKIKIIEIYLIKK